MSNVFDKHNQFIIRFPEDVADALNEYFENGEEGVEITLQADPEPKNTTKRVSLKVTVDEKTYDASVVSMPTVSSTFKTIDRINFFKSNDVSEMIYVHENEFDILNESDAEPIKKANRAGQQQLIQKYLGQSGLTEPTENIKQRFFRQRSQIDKELVKNVDLELGTILTELNQKEKNQENYQTRKDE